ncbi:MAG: hypothetical protein CVU39_05215 [Chloroflexi bacterium HGW-Chloroflexi-10]|nr:MAG: hypothetical protein CVU39_05215 [Chloroflexi bacterium HGW-Chloroflexi-10]
MKIDLERIEILNRIYQPLHLKFKAVKAGLIANHFVINEAGWFNMHSVRNQDEFLDEFFPIPVLTVEGVIDIGLELDFTFVETTVSKEKIITFQPDNFTEYDVEIYGVKNYLIDYYRSDIKVNNFLERIQMSDEQEFHLTVNLPAYAKSDEVIDVLNFLQEFL